MTGSWSAPGHERGSTRASPYSSYQPAPYPDYGAAPLPGQGTADPFQDAVAPPGSAQRPEAMHGGAPAGVPGSANQVPHDPFALPPALAQQVLAGPGYESPKARNSTWSILTMVLAIPLFFIPWASLAVIALGHVALHQLKSSYHGGRGLALGGLMLAYLSVVGWAAFYLL